MTDLAPSPQVAGTISIRLLKQKDIPAMLAMVDDPEIEKLTIFADAKKNGESKEAIFTQMLNANKNGWFCSYAVLQDGQCVGYANSYATEDTPEINSLGCWIAASHRGKGIASKALTLLIDQIETSYSDLRNVFAASVAPDNTASLRMMGKLGFVETKVPIHETSSAMPVRHFILQPRPGL